MHIKAVTKSKVTQANIRDTLEVVLLFLDVVSAAICVIRKDVCGGGHDNGHDDDHGHTH